MSRDLPVISVIIPAPPGLSEVQSAEAVRHLDYPADRMEILVARGRQPSVQRNTALRAARGEFVYFLDDDVWPAHGNLRRLVEVFQDSDVAMLGGPSLCPPDAPALERVFGLVLSAWLALGPSRARYARMGRRRQASEKELILCNLAARREVVLQLGGFDEALYPNEENALMDGLQAKGFKLIHDPEFSAFRRPRPDLRSFAKMMSTYGRGRAEQFRLHPTLGSALNFVPPLFCVYVLLIPLGVRWPWVLWPAAAYVLVLAVQALALIRQGRALAAAVAPLIVLTHLMYGLGFWKGLFTSLSRGTKGDRVEVRLETIRP